MSAQPEWTLHSVPERPRTTWNAAELMAVSFPEPTWAVPGIIAEGVTLLAGPPKVGKSWLSLGLGLSIAAGLPALGTIDIEPGPVLYLALEDTPRRLRSRMGTVLAGRPAPTGLTLETYCPPLPTGGDAYIAGWLDENPGARLVVIDVFTKVRGNAPAGTNSAYEADYAAVTRIKRVADTYAVPVVLVHHVRKAAAEDFLATVSGTNGLAGASGRRAGARTRQGASRRCFARHWPGRRRNRLRHVLRPQGWSMVAFGRSGRGTPDAGHPRVGLPVRPGVPRQQTGPDRRSLAAQGRHRPADLQAHGR